jgi:hypothetical protein
VATNRLKFEGILAYVGTPSDLAPSGARGHRVLLTKEHAQICIHTLCGQGVNVNSDLHHHDVTRKIGVITEAKLYRNRIKLSGHLWDKDFPAEVARLQASGNKLGMSFDADESFVPNMRESVWEIRPARFTGAAILLKKKASYQKSSFKIVKE